MIEFRKTCLALLTFLCSTVAQSAHAPIHEVQSSDGLVGAQYSQRDRYISFVEELSAALLRNLDYDV